MYRNECHHGVDNPHGKSKTEIRRMTALATLTVHNAQTMQNAFHYRTNGLKSQAAGAEDGSDVCDILAEQW